LPLLLFFRRQRLLSSIRHRAVALRNARMALAVKRDFWDSNIAYLNIVMPIQTAPGGAHYAPRAFAESPEGAAGAAAVDLASPRRAADAAHGYWVAV
jgi:hypothetical protein